jgi:hypothetical protein
MADEDTQNDDTGDGNDDAGKSDAGGNDAGDEKFQAITSQEELDRIVGRRLNKERARFADYDQLKDKAKKYDELDEQNKSELEKAQARAEAAEKAAADARDEAKATRLRSAVISEAVTQKAAKPDQVFRLIDASEFDLDDDGQPKNASAVVGAFLAENPHMVDGGTNGAGKQGADQGTRSGGKGDDQLTREDLAKMSPEAIRKATAEGRFADVAAGSGD